MSRRIIKFKSPRKSSSGFSAFLFISAITSAVAVFGAMFLIIKFSGWTQDRPEYVSGPMRGVALEEVLYKPVAIEESDVKIQNIMGAGMGAVRGQTDVTFLNFSVMTNESAKVQKLVFSIDGFARPDDISGLQLYLDDKFVAEKPLFEGKAVFEGLNINVDARETYHFRVKGKIDEDAFAGDRVQIGINNMDDIVIRGSSSKVLSVGGDVPLWGRYVSVIGEQLR